MKLYSFLKAIFRPILSGLSVGLRADQVSLYLQDMYKAEWQSYMAEPTKHDKIFKVETAPKAPGNKSTQLLGLGRLTRHTSENQDINFRAPVEGWAYYCKYWTFSDGLVLSKEAVEDVGAANKVKDLLKDLAATWGESVRFEKETFAATVFNDGGDLLGSYIFNGSHTGQTDPSGNLLYDSKPLFNLTGNARTSKGGGTYFNAVASLTLTPANFETLYNLFTVSMAFDEQDRVCTANADTLLTECGAQSFLAKRILTTSQGLPGGQLNDKNVYEGLVQPMDWRYLSDSSAFYVGKKNHPKFQWHDRQTPDMRFFRDETNRSYKASIDIRFGVWVKDFRAWAKGGGSFA